LEIVFDDSVLEIEMLRRTQAMKAAGATTNIEN
jgi:hypothetical protein